MSVVNGIVQAHGGVIMVQSEIGNGSEFSLYFPVTSRVATHGRGVAAIMDPALIEAKPIGKQVIVIDDESMMVSLAQRLLQREGHRVRTFVDAEEALRLIRANPDAIDIVVTDFNMPRLSGLEIARAVRALRADLPVLISSGFVSAELEEEARRTGAHLIAKTDLVTGLVREIECATASSARTVAAG